MRSVVHLVLVAEGVARPGAYLGDPVEVGIDIAAARAIRCRRRRLCFLVQVFEEALERKRFNRRQPGVFWQRTVGGGP